MYIKNYSICTGFYGEVLPFDSGLTVVVKSHGHTTGKATQFSRSEQKKYNHIAELNGTAILLIRNPFRAIIGHRHLDAGGHTGYADVDQFLGEGESARATRRVAISAKNKKHRAKNKLIKKIRDGHAYFFLTTINEWNKIRDVTVTFFLWPKFRKECHTY